MYKMRLLLCLSLCFHLIYSCEYSQKFTECFNNQMAVKLSPQNCEDSRPKLITNLPCNISCDSGTFLSYRVSSNSLECLPCPSNTYSLGGGTEYSSWNSLESFNTYCWVFSPNGWLLNTNCTAWHSNSDSFLVSGTADYSAWYQTDLFFYPTLVKAGHLTVFYRIEMTPISRLDCQFMVSIDHETVYTDFNEFSPNWQSANFELTEGPHVIKISFIKIQTNMTTKAIIKTIRITGLKYADDECIECESGKLDNSIWCLSCGAGSYLDGLKCEVCPAGTISKPGSNSSEDCINAANCTETDYHFYYTKCFGGVKKKIYEWNEILRCSNLGLSLPEIEEIQCLPCGPGKVLINGLCESCLVGFYSDGIECILCDAGKYAPKVKEFDFWTPFPLGFETFCVSDYHNCDNNWESRGGYLVTSSFYVEHSRIILQKKVVATEVSASVEFLVEIRGIGTTFGLLINGVNVYNQTLNIKESQEFYLNLGENNLKWVCYHGKTSNEVCLIYKITFKGTAEGGGEKCIDCPDGFISKKASEICTKCDAGMTSNSDHTDCVSCDTNMITNSKGICSHCPDNLVPSFDKRSCIVSESGYLIINETSFNVSYLTGSEQKRPAYCEDKENQCYKSFYGPVVNSELLFYLSAFNPSTVDMPEFPQISNEKAYSFGILHTNESPIHSSVIKQKENDCLGNSSKIVVNLGTEVKTISKISTNKMTGFEVRYINGDTCMSSQRFSTKIYFTCNKDEKEGWPVLIQTDTCEFTFKWDTVFACGICEEEEWIFHREECHNGSRKVIKSAGTNCIGKDNINIIEYYEKCNNGYFSSLSITMVSIAFVVLIFTVVILYYIVYQRRKKYWESISKTITTDPGAESERVDN